MTETSYSDGAGLTLKTSEFRLISQLAHERFGLELKGGKEALVAARLGKYLRKGGFKSFDEYYHHVLGDKTGDALIGLIDSLTTNHTSFLREKAHFEFLSRAVVEEFQGIQALDIWCAASSSGEEPYTIAMCLADTLNRAGAARRDFRILATDISTRVLGIAKRGVYPVERFNDLPDAWRKAFLLRGAGDCKGLFKFKPEVMSHISFERLNLIQPFPHKKHFHVIFCRNVMMYFDKPTQEDIVQRMSACLESGGYLFVGHSESLTGVEHELKYVRPATYRKEGSGRGLRGRS
ncbi:MAG TPA: protein-glutamate O-methyltransferase CheR [Bryobacteraceae bacterium]|nr:protein-glutamate O-methyltransferase CheR [Bryobacteraceae bacterium]